MSRPLRYRARAGSSRPALAVYFLTVTGTLVWISAIFLAPYLANRGAGSAARLIYTAFSPVCHQIPERCFLFYGHVTAVCGRCLGIYAGFAAGLVFYPFVRGFKKLALPSARIFLLMTFPMALDAGAGIFGVWKSPIGLRFATGAVWGTLLPFYFVTGIADLIVTRKIRTEARALEIASGKNIE